MGMLGYSILYIIWGIVDIFNLVMVYKNLYIWKINKRSTKLLWAVCGYFLVTVLFACMSQQKFSIGCLILYIPFYLKAVPVMRCYFEKQKMQMLIVTVLLYQEIISFIGQLVSFVVEADIQHISWSRDLSYAVTSFLMLIVIMIMLNLNKTSAISLYLKDIPLKVYYILCAVVYCTGIVMDGMFVGQIIEGADLSFMRIFLVLLMFFLCWLIFEIVNINHQKVSKSKIADFMEEQMKGMTEYYNELSIKENELHRFRHDVKNLLIVLHSMVEQKHYDKALEYIENMESMYKATVKGFDTGNIIADALLNTKMNVAKEHNIKIVFEGFVPAQKIEDLDISILLSNILDNAIEACQKIDGEKVIHIESVLVKRMWILTVKNPVKGDIVISDNKIGTSKKNKELHGYGILNVRRVAESYNGSLQLACENGEFITKANLFLGNKTTA